MNKQEVKFSEARVLVFLAIANNEFKFASKISAKLGIEYNFLLKRLNEMKTKDWIVPIRRHNRVFYQLTDIAPLSKAKEMVSSETK